MNKEELLQLINQCDELLQGDGLTTKQKRTYKIQLNTYKIKLESGSLSDIAQKIGQINVQNIEELRRLSTDLRANAATIEKQVAFAEKALGLLKLVV